MTSYVVTDSMGVYSWLPSGEPHANALEKWRTGGGSFSGFTGDVDVSMSQYVMYRIRLVLAGDLADCWADFGGLVAQLNLIALVTDMPTTDHPWVAIAYYRRIPRRVPKLSQKRARSTDYFSILSAFRPDIKAGVLRDFEFDTGLIKKGGEADQAKKDKARAGKQAGKKSDKLKRWSGGDWVVWKKAQRAIQAATKDETKTDSTEKKPAEKGSGEK